MQQGQGGPVQGVSGVSACLQELNSQSESGIQLMDHTNQSQVQGHSQSHQHVDDFLEQILNIPSWSEVGASVKAPWDYNNSNNNNNGSMSLAAENMNIDINPRLFTISLMPAGLGNERHGTSGYSSSAENLHFSSSAFENSILDSRQNESLIGGGASESPASMVLQLGSSPRLAVGAAKTRSPSSGGSSASDGSCSAASSIQSPTQAHAWRLPFAGGGGGGVRNPLPLSLGQAMGEEARLLGERLRDEEAIRPLNRVMLPSFGSGLGIRPNNQQSFLAQNLGATIQPQLQTPAGLVPTPTAITATAPTPARPRARARRGQATDPHSIAERQRRERIAERMKALQELVPSCNKTDRAAMLDDILDYVKFLQFQVKVLSMSRIGGAAAVAPLITEMSSEGQGASSSRNNDSQISSSEESLAMTERQVARLMEEDMGAAMQYLQSKGLCVMPLSLATAMAGSQRSILPTAATNRISALPQADRDHESITEALPRGATATDNANGFNTVVKSEGQSLRGGPPK